MPNYVVIEEDVTADPDPQTLLNLFSVAGAGRGYIYDILISSGDTPSDSANNFDLKRTTVVGTELAGFTPNRLDPDTVVSTFDAGASHTTEPTETANSELMAFSLNKRATFRWVAAPDGELIIPATTANGISVVRRSSVAQYVLDCTIYFRE